MQFSPPLVEARLVRRYNRFLADVEHGDGRIETAHCPNPGRMSGVAPSGARVWLTRNDDPKRKLKLTWELVETDGGLVGINTANPNRIVAEALADGPLQDLRAGGIVRPEVRYGENSRADFIVTAPKGERTIIEVKNVHLMRRPELAEFPDSVTARGAKHLRELAAARGAGDRAVMVYLVQRMDCVRFALASDIDPVYAAAFADARAAGVETFVLDCDITQNEINARRFLRFADDEDR